MGVSYNSVINRDGLVLHLVAGNSRSYPGTGTTWYDLSGNNNHGALTNGPTYSSSNGGVINFDGVNDQINLSRGIAFPANTPYAVTCWINKTALNSNRLTNGGIFRDGSTSTFLVTNENTGRLWGTHNGINISNANNGPLLLNVGWCHVGLQWDGATASLIFNGSVFITVSASSSLAFTISVIGQQVNNFLLAQIDDVRIYNRALPLLEIRQIFNSTRRRFGV